LRCILSRPRQHTHAPADVGDVRSREALGLLSHEVQVHVRGHVHLPQTDPQQLCTAQGCRHTHTWAPTHGHAHTGTDTHTHQLFVYINMYNLMESTLHSISFKAHSRPFMNKLALQQVFKSTRVDCVCAFTCGQGDVDPLLQTPPQRLVDVPGEVGGRQDHHHFGGVVVLHGPTHTCTQNPAPCITYSALIG